MPIIFPVAAAWSLGLVEGGLVSLVWTYVVSATINARIGMLSPNKSVLSGRPRSIHKNLLLSGTRAATSWNGYTLRESFRILKGVEPMAKVMLGINANKMGNWISVGRQEPKGLMPFSR